MVEITELKENFEKIKNFFLNKKVQTILVISFLLIILIFGAWVRVQNLPSLKDGTTGEYIPLALDPFYFLRVAETIVDQGGLPSYDEMRDPMITDTSWHPEILPKAIVFIYKIMKPLGGNITIQFVDVISPVIFFVLGLIIFFFLVYFLTKSKWLALISSSLLTVIPPYLYRTLSGFSDHEAIGMFAFFLAMLSLIVSLKFIEQKDRNWLNFIFGGFITGIFMILTIVSWGGVAKFLFMIIPFSFFVVWLMKLKQKKILPKYISYYFSLIVGIFIGSVLFSYPIGDLVRGTLLSPAGILTFFVLGYVVVDYILIKYFKHYFSEKLKKYRGVLSAVIVVILGMIFYQIFIGNVVGLINTILSRLIYPFGTERVGLTVAENKQPYLTEWISQIGKFIF